LLKLALVLFLYSTFKTRSEGLYWSANSPWLETVGKHWSSPFQETCYFEWRNIPQEFLADKYAFARVHSGITAQDWSWNYLALLVYSCVTRSLVPTHSLHRKP